MSQTITLATTLETVTCYTCGALFAMPSALMRRFLDTGATFYCPLGHGQRFTETIQQKLNDALGQVKQTRERAEARVRAARDQAEAAERSNRALRGHNTKLKKRIAAGVCPCCHRSFQNLARHMVGQHPGFASDEAVGGAA